MIIQEHFTGSVYQFCRDARIAESLWRELEEKYSAKSRHFHTLDHLNHILKQLIPLRDAFTNWHMIVFAVAYHDAVYNPLRSNNEEKSASLAAERLKTIGLSEELLRKCQQLILATKKHEPSDYETNLLTDADLSVLGSDSDIYDRYSKGIRREYGMYPDIVYNAGRKKVLLRYLSMDSIFKTKEFSDRLEVRARENLKRELGGVVGRGG